MMAHFVRWKGEPPQDRLFNPTKTERGKLLEELMRKRGDLCTYCGCKTFLPWELMPGSPKKYCATLDHEPPRHAKPYPLRRSARGLVIACSACNNAKGPLDAATFMRVRHDGKALAEAKRLAHAVLELTAKHRRTRADEE